MERFFSEREAAYLRGDLKDAVTDVYVRQMRSRINSKLRCLHDEWPLLKAAFAQSPVKAPWSDPSLNVLEPRAPAPMTTGVEDF